MTKNIDSFSVIGSSGHRVIPHVTARLRKSKDEGIRKGFPWAYCGDLVDSSEWQTTAPGSLCTIEDHKGAHIGMGYINPKSQITCRVLALGQEKINETFFEKRLKLALSKREKSMGIPYYRLAHSEADFLPGLTIDRFGDVYSIQVSTAGMEKLQPLWMSAFEKLFSPKAIVLRNDTSSRKLEGLKQEVIAVPSLPAGEEYVQLREYDTIFLADLIKGQKTGWFYDQRDNRKMIADVAKDKTLLDVYSHSGGFGIPAARAGAKVTMVDSSKLALEIAKKVAALNHTDCEMICGDAFEVMKNLVAEKKTYDIVLADPPAFIKSKKDIAAGLKGYEKVARHAAVLVKKNGLLFMASCSHHASRGSFNNAVMEGVKKAGCSAEILKQTGAAPDHPIHPKLPQSEYLKGLLLRIA